MRSRFAPLYALLLCSTVLATVALAELREWSDFTGAFKSKGELIAYDGKVARLSLDIGQTVNLPIEKLSTADQEYLKSSFPNGKSPELLKMKTPAKGGAGAAAGKASVKVELAGVAIVKPSANLPAEVAPLPSGTHIWLMVSDPEATLAGVDTEKSKIASFTDNKGTDLAEGESAEAAFEFTPLPDGKSGLVHLHRPQVPESKSVRATLKGQLHLQSGPDGSTISVPLNLEVTLGL